MILKIKQHQIKALSILYSVFFAVRLSTGAFHVIYLIGSGLETSFVILLTAIFSTSSLIFGLFIEKFGYRYQLKSLVIFCVFMSALYSATMSLAPNKVAIIISEISYGISLAGIYSALFCWLTQLIKNESSIDADITYKTNYYKHFSISLGSFLAVLTSSIIPITFAYFSLNLRYIFIINIFMFIGIAVVLFSINGVTNKLEKKSSIKKVMLFTLIRQDYLIIILLFTAILFMVAMVPIFQLWQLFFQEKLRLDIASSQLLYFLAAFNFATFFAQFIFNRYIPKKLYFSNFLVPCSYSFLSALGLFSIIFFDTTLIIFLGYFIFQGSSSIVGNSIDNYILSKYKEHTLRLLNLIHMVMRVVSIIYSIFMSILVNFLSIPTFFCISAIAFISIGVLLLIPLRLAKQSYSNIGYHMRE